MKTMSQQTDGNDDETVRPLSPMEIGVFVRARREANGWSQETLAELSGLSARTIQRVEDGQPSSVDTRRALARGFEFPDIDFFIKAMPEPDELQIRKLVEECRRLQTEKTDLHQKMGLLNTRAEAAQAMLNMAAARDVRWLTLVRTTMMPKQPGRVPFHNAAEIAVRGYHCSLRQTPILTSVTWSPLPYNEGGLHRGYHAGLILTGSQFVPGVTIAKRFKGAPANGAPDMSNLWHQPNIYFGNYLEIASSVEADGPVSWEGMEFCVRSPEGQMSEWIEFQYPFDRSKLLSDLGHLSAEGERLLRERQAGAAVEPLRRAWVISRALFGWGSEKYVRCEQIWNRAVDEAALNKLRFREGAHLRVVSGPHEGKTGNVVKILTRHLHAYVISAGNEEVQAADAQVELL